LETVPNSAASLGVPVVLTSVYTDIPPLSDQLDIREIADSEEVADVVVVVVYDEIVPGSAVARGMEVAPGNEDVRNGCGRIVNAAKSPSAIVPIGLSVRME
jgi:hypothetical protein